MKNHAEECTKKPKKCPYCEIDVKFDKYDEHIQYCGGRTQMCPKCNKNIRISDYQSHEMIDCMPKLQDTVTKPKITKPTTTKEETKRQATTHTTKRSSALPTHEERKIPTTKRTTATTSSRTTTTSTATKKPAITGISGRGMRAGASTTASRSGVGRGSTAASKASTVSSGAKRPTGVAKTAAPSSGNVKKEGDKQVAGEDDPFKDDNEALINALLASDMHDLDSGIGGNFQGQARGDPMAGLGEAAVGGGAGGYEEEVRAPDEYRQETLLGMPDYSHGNAIARRTEREAARGMGPTGSSRVAGNRGTRREARMEAHESGVRFSETENFDVNNDWQNPYESSVTSSNVFASANVGSGDGNVDAEDQLMQQILEESMKTKVETASANTGGVGGSTAATTDSYFESAEDADIQEVLRRSQQEH
mmetsp:Transcript_61093/g.69953  ORF Transcript_61093/g.69953 Transcript_61093/m.69953 type:complete len:421 (-) Transcript_61093:2585-3847(-)